MIALVLYLVMQHLVSQMAYICYVINYNIAFFQGYIFVDRDGEHFRHILNWLRDGVIPTLKDSDYAELLREAEYYQLLVNYTLFPFDIITFLLLYQILILSFLRLDINFVYSGKCFFFVSDCIQHKK